MTHMQALQTIYSPVLWWWCCNRSQPQLQHLDQGSLHFPPRNAKGMAHLQGHQGHQRLAHLQFLCIILAVVKTIHSLAHAGNKQEDDFLPELLCTCRRTVTLASVIVHTAWHFLAESSILHSISAKEHLTQPAFSHWWPWGVT